MVLRKSGLVKGCSKNFSPVREKCAHIKDRLGENVRRRQWKAFFLNPPLFSPSSAEKHPGGEANLTGNQRSRQNAKCFDFF
jgi:hypothetical protein